MLYITSMKKNLIVPFGVLSNVLSNYSLLKVALNDARIEFATFKLVL